MTRWNKFGLALFIFYTVSFFSATSDLEILFSLVCMFAGYILFMYKKSSGNEV